jgi:uncharacterized protein (TIGR02588 family)
MNIPKKNLLEWSVFGLSLLLLIGVVGLLAYDAIWGDRSPPELVVQAGEPVARGALIEVPVTVENRGGRAAEGILVEVTVRQAGGVEERAELTLPLLARQASEQGVVAVPNQGAVEAVEGRVVAFTLP